MGEPKGRADAPVQHGYPHLSTVRSAVTALYRRLSADTVGTFTASVRPSQVTLGEDEDLHLGAARVAGALVRHLRLPDARVVVSFRAMEHAASVEWDAGPAYFVELNDRFREHRRDVGAALAHEVMHVYLHRLGLSFPDLRANEVLTDTASAYLGSGWPLLDAFRQDGASSQKLGFLTPEEFGYVLAKRAVVFGEDPSPWFTSPQAYEAYTAGRELVLRDGVRPPLAGAPRAARRRYVRDRRSAGRRLHPARPVDGAEAVVEESDEGYVFERDEDGLRVSFPCPTCRQRVRVPVRGRVRARCALCRSELDCDT